MRVMILGMGRWGHVWYDVLTAAGEEVVLTAGGRKRAESAALHFENYVEALQAATAVDAALITLPVELHLDAVQRCVERGIAVLCEKPAVPDRRALDRLLAEASRPDALVRVDQNYRTRSWARRTREVLATLGAIGQVEISFARREDLGGGRTRLRHPLLDDMSIHHVDLLRFLTGSEVEVLGASASRPKWSAFAQPSDLSALMRLAGGARVVYSGSWSARGSETPWDGDWRFRCERGVLEVSNRRPSLNQGDGPVPVTVNGDVNEDEDLVLVWEEFRRAVAGDRSAGVSVEDHARSLNLVFDLAAAANVS